MRLKVNVGCYKCGETLVAEFRYCTDDELLLNVYPCPTCLAAAKKEGREEASKEQSDD